MEFLDKLLLLRQDIAIASIEAKLEALEERMNQQERNVQRIESGSDYISRVIDDMQRDIDVWR